MTLAAAMDDPAYLKELIKHGADPAATVPAPGDTPLIKAALHGKTDNIALLIASAPQLINAINREIPR